MKTRFVKMSNALILDSSLKPSRKRVYQALLANQRDGQVRRTYAELAACSGCSVGTVRQAVADLAAAGYIGITKTYRFSEAAEQLLKDTCIYRIHPQDFSLGFAMVPCKLLKQHITHAAYLVALYLLKLIGTGRRAWPSLRRGFEQALGLSRTTVCDAVRQLMSCKILVRLRCLTASRAYSMSSYYLTLWGEETAAVGTNDSCSAMICKGCPNAGELSASSDRGGSVFDKHPLSTKITWSSMLRKREKGVLEFVKLNKYFAHFVNRIKAAFFCPRNKDAG